MKVFYLLRVLLLLGFSLLARMSFAQCPTGWNGTATLKWDNRCYLTTSGNYNGYVTTAMTLNQNFTLGTNSVNIARTASITSNGGNNVITAVAGSYGSGASVSYNGNGTITLTFDTVVANLQFSLYSIDNKQTAAVTAADASGTPLDINMTTVQAGIITLGGTATNPTATANATSWPGTGTDYRGVVNVQINGMAPAGANGVKSVTITIGGTGGAFWLSDLSACVFSGFPTNYYLVSKPFTGQPAYILNNSNAPTASTTDVATGKCRYVFTDNAAGNPYINSLGYDPYKHILYYTLDGLFTGTNSTNKGIKKYDFNTLSANNATMNSGTISTVIADMTQAPYNVPVFDQGVESASAAFYGGSYYFGIEGSNKIGSPGTSGRNSMIWRLDFDAAGNPRKISQVWAFIADDGNQVVQHNWSDFSISNGILYDFSSAGPSGDGTGQFTHCNLQTGLIVNTYYPNGNPVPGQSGTAWNENIYWLDNSVDQMALYNKNGTIGGAYPLSGKATIDWTPSGSGDASDAFKPPIDYGDAPASYDPVTVDPAGHDYDSTLKLGTLWNAEFAKKTTVDASGDGVTDDGLTGPPVFTNGQTTYGANVNVYNHSGAAVTVAGWIDLNNNGLFDPTEGAAVTLSTSNTSLQLVHLSWTGSAIPPGVSFVFMRIRVTSKTNGMTASNPNGYFSNGEVEDYKISVSNVLQTTLVSFAATPVNDQSVHITWQTANEMNMESYIVERSADGINWSSWQMVSPLNTTDNNNTYSANDPRPFPGVSYYRLKMVSYSGNFAYSEIAKVAFRSGPFSIASLSPNPFKDVLTVNIVMPKAGAITLRLIDTYGNILYAGSVYGNQGNNTIVLPHLPSLTKGIYILEATSGPDIAREKVLKE
jgi:hypothetical protein